MYVICNLWLATSDIRSNMIYQIISNNKITFQGFHHISLFKITICLWDVSGFTNHGYSLQEEKFSARVLAEVTGLHDCRSSLKPSIKIILMAHQNHIYWKLKHNSIQTWQHFMNPQHPSAGTAYEPPLPSPPTIHPPAWPFVSTPTIPILLWQPLPIPWASLY